MFKIQRVKVIEIGYKYMNNSSVCLQAINHILNAMFSFCRYNVTLL